MILQLFNSHLISSALISFSAVIIYYNLTKKKKKQVPKTQVIFFTRKQSNCRDVCFVSKIPCGAECSLMKIQTVVNAIETAEISINACIFLITNFNIADAIIRAHKRGVYVRIIYDASMAFSTESKISNFINEGITVKSNVSESIKNMHHKYCIIDVGAESQKVITGSTNWTSQGLAGNYEYCAISSQPNLIQEYQKMFDKLWDIFDTKT